MNVLRGRMPARWWNEILAPTLLRERSRKKSGQVHRSLCFEVHRLHGILIEMHIVRWLLEERQCSHGSPPIRFQVPDDDRTDGQWTSVAVLTAVNNCNCGNYSEKEHRRCRGRTVQLDVRNLVRAEADNRYR